MRMGCCFFPSLPSCPSPNLGAVKSKCLFLFKSAQYHLSDAFCTPITSVYWSLRSCSHKVAPSSSKANRPPKLSSLSDDDNWIDAYAQTHFSGSQTAAFKDLNKKIRKGTCFAQCAFLTNKLLDDANTNDLPTLVKQLPQYRPELAALQAREWIRFAHDAACDDDAQFQDETWLADHETEEFYVSDKAQVKQTLQNALNASGLMMVHCTDGKKTHVLLIKAQANQLTFFNPSSFGGGCFIYDNQDKGLDAFLAHLSANSFFLKTNARWKLKKF